MQAQAFPQAPRLGEGRMLAQAFRKEETGQLKVLSPAPSRGVGWWLGTFLQGQAAAGQEQAQLPVAQDESTETQESNGSACAG